MNEPNKNPNTTKKPVTVRNIPKSDLALADVSKKVSLMWSSNVWMTLRWTTPEAFSTKTATFGTTLSSKRETVATRPQITQALKVLDKKIDGSISYVKGYITTKYKKENAMSYYGAFGIKHESGGYRIPKDQNERSGALALMLSGIVANDFADEEYGTVFWTNIKTQYDNLLAQASSKDGKVAEKVGSKKILKAEIIKTLNSLVSIIKGNYPDTYKEELRNWGFQKEKY